MEVSFIPTAETALPDSVTQFVDSVNNVFVHLLEDVVDVEMVGSLYITR